MARRVGDAIWDALVGRPSQSPPTITIDPSSVREVRGPNVYDPTVPWYNQRDSTSMIRDGGVYLPSNAGGRPGVSQRVGDATIPDWASGRFAPGEEDGFRNYSQSLEHPAIKPFRGFIEEAERENARTERETRAATQRGITTLQGAADRAAGLLEGFQTDPDRAAIGGELQRRAGADYRAIPEEVEQGYLGQIARAGATQRARIGDAQSAANVRGPRASYDDEALAAVVSAQGAGLQAQVAEANQRSRDEALSRYSQYTDRSTAIEADLVGGLTAIDGAIAALEAGEQFAPSDILALANMQFGLEQYRDQVAFAMEGLEGYEKSQSADLLDYLNFGLSLIGSGIFA